MISVEGKVDTFVSCHDINEYISPIMIYHHFCSVINIIPIPKFDKVLVLIDEQIPGLLLQINI